MDDRTTENSFQTHSKDKEENVVNLLELANIDDELDIWGLNDESTEKIGTERFVQDESKPTGPATASEIPALPQEVPIPIIQLLKPLKPMLGTDFAIMLDSSKSVNDFHKRIPEMAMEFEFELDNFQKLAILHLEQHDHVFVAAHTSAGKTVVAEYAIALSKRHNTKAIYTSPIKALSNQKYRDFKRIFHDVGLITGDFQINETASCLIMTTEILRSMLYNGSEVTRDLEYVIFDEVHYINDPDRGHVWEQVLMLLPEHVCVILLSATCPNALEFADWLGRTHQRKVYVVNTYTRPVPLAHHLYTGSGSSSRDNCFQVMGDNFIDQGYMKALKTLPKSIRDKTLCSALVDYLRRRELLPAIQFTFSRARCDNLAECLTNLDLTSKVEKSHIHSFFEKCLRHLKEADREIPQILRMREVLTRGIGVHHSGILPMVKEIVEMLFQNGLVKLLFATETFAMGVNMPARTVIFDSIDKFDGISKRNLLPAEYIQMAGRAGRRGKDKEGTVIILCKTEPPSSDELKRMMLGKPSLLKSQFRLTYGLILRLLRVEQITVEDIMSRSFMEADHMKQQVDIRKELEKVEALIAVNNNKEISAYMQPLVKFYDRASDYLQCREEYIDAVMKHPKVQKELKAGRYLIITHGKHINKLALILQTSMKYSQITYRVLVLTDDEEASSVNDIRPIWFKMLALASSDKIYTPSNGPTGHAVLTIEPQDVFEICTKTSKINTEFVLKDWEKRQLPRFKDDPLGQTCQSALMELSQLSMSVADLRTVDILKDLKANEQGVFENLIRLSNLKDNVIAESTAIQVPNFAERFHEVFEMKYLQDRKAKLEHLLSHEALSLFREYKDRIMLLRERNYIDDNDRVMLKGNVACGMSMNELVTTELVLENVLSGLTPAEVAALLSATVFQGKTREDQNAIIGSLPDTLQNGIFRLIQIHDDILKSERTFHIMSLANDQILNFGLVHVVYHWASGLPFAEIMQLTDIQEGIIVRCIQQLNDIISDVKDGAKLMGDSALEQKMVDSSTAIKRDIVFAESLYTLKLSA